MIELNKLNGDLKINGTNLSSSISIKNLYNSLFPFNIELWFSNGIWKQYKFVNEPFIFILHFELEKLLFISISIKVSSKYSIGNTLDSLGGKNNYSWGEIDIYNDIKSGTSSILIKYL
jgi:hypothetical protein